MDIVKKNLISIICGVVAVATLVAVFVWPLDGYFESLKAKADTRAKVLGKIETLKRTPRAAPIVELKDQKPTPLTKFPSRGIIDKGDIAQKLMQSQSAKMYEYAWKLNQQGHGVVVPGVLPVKLSEPIAMAFRKNLMEALNKLRTEELSAGIPPTDDQKKIREEALAEEITKKELIVLPDGTKTNEDKVKLKIEAEIAKLPDMMKQEMASKYKMYIDPATVLTASASLPADTSPTPTAIWWSQVSYWVYSDVAAAIKEMNASSTNVLESPIKNLLSLSVPEDFFPSVMSGGNGRSESDPADAPTVATGGRPDPTIALPDGGASSPTKRVSNNLFDVLQFKMKLDIEADKIPLFLKTLATNRFLTVTRVEMNPVDSQAKQVAGYVYGNQPVVTLDLELETIFMREWTIPLMPPVIKTKLGIPDTAAKQP